MPVTEACSETFSRSRDVLVPFAATFVVTADDAVRSSLDAPHPGQYPDGLSFAEVRAGNRYVGFPLMPVYVFPDLLDDIRPELTPELTRRTRGKSCFDFTALVGEAADELDRLKAVGFDRYRSEGLVR